MGSEMDDGFEGKSQYGQMPSNAQLTKLEGLCRKFVNAALNDDSLEECKKLGAWRNRANQLLDDLRLMKNVCLKQAQEGGNGGDKKPSGGGGGYSGKPTKAPTKAPYAGKPTKKPTPTKKPKY